MDNTIAPSATPNNPGSNAAIVPILLLATFLGGLLFLMVPAVWIAEQFAIISGETFGRTPWIIAQATMALLVLLPSLALAAAVKTPRMRAVFQTWSLVGLFALIMLPVQLAPGSSAQTAALLQIGGALAYLLLLKLIRRRQGKITPVDAGSLWPAVLLAALVGWPWVLWGALGSWLDTVLNLLAAALFGLAAAASLRHTLWPHINPRQGNPPLPFFIAGVATSITLMIMGAAFGHNGQQLVLLTIMAGLGWLVAAVGQKSQGVGPATWPQAALLIGLAAALPLIFFDPEELLLILNLGSRDVGYFVLYATLISLGMALILALIVWLTRNVNGGRVVPALLAAAALAGLALVYVFFGQPGWYGERLYVVMAEQADLSAAADIADPTERRQYVYGQLTDHANATQAGIRHALEAAGINYRPYYLINALEIDAGPLVRLWLASQPEVDRVLISPELRPLPEQPPLTTGSAAAPDAPMWNLVDIGAPQVWDEFGARGAGIIIGQSDSGVEGSHPELSVQYRGAQAAGPAGDDYNWYDPWNASLSPTDIGGHGTHTLGSILGRTVGVAPEAAWIGCVNLGRNLGNPPRYLDCLQFHLAPFPQAGDALKDGRAELGANVLNNSWGCPEIEGCDPTSLLAAVRALRAAGVFVVASAGNDGSACSTIADPISLYDEVFSVGAIDEFGEIAPFSSRGPVLADGSGRIKPDVVAPGVDVLSAMPGGTYEYNSGTSMAGPHVAGVVALLWSADASLIGDIERTERLLTQTATPLDELPGLDICGDQGELPNNVSGYGLINAYAAVQMALSENE